MDGKTKSFTEIVIQMLWDGEDTWRDFNAKTPMSSFEDACEVAKEYQRFHGAEGYKFRAVERHVKTWQPFYQTTKNKNKKRQNNEQ